MKRCLLLAAATALCAACPPAAGVGVDDEASAASEGSDSAQVAGDEAATMELAVEGAGGAAKPELSLDAVQIAAAAAARVAARVQPAGCETATIVDSTVTYSFNECTGPRGLVHVTGTLTVVYSVDVAGIHAHATASGLAVNESTIDLDATATYDLAGGANHLTVETDSSGTGPLGHSFTHQGSYTVSWTDTCFTLNGTWSTRSGDATRATTVSNLTRCLGYCPQAGGSIAHTFRTGVTLTITFDGAIAAWTDGRNSGTIRLTCVPQP
jgi:hypothetical protein